MKKYLLLSTCLLINLTLSKSQEIDKEEFKPSGNIIAQIFADYMYAMEADTGAVNLGNAVLNKKESFNSFQIRLFHLGYQYYFTPKITTLFLLDVEDISLTSDDKYSTFIKDAWIKWNIFTNHHLKFGVQDVLQLESCETLWGYRYLEKSISDLRGLVGGREFGLSLRGKTEKVGYGIMVSNSSGLKPENDNYKRLFVNFVYTPAANIAVQVYADENFKPKTNDIEKNETSVGLVAGYTIADKYSIGVDGYFKNSKNGYTDGLSFSDLNTYAISAFASIKIMEKSKFILRYDYFEPCNKIKSDARNYLLAAYEFSPIPKFQISPNILIETYEKMGNRDVTKSVWARLTVNWTIN